MLEITVSTRGLEFDALAKQFSGPLRQKFVERLTAVVWASAFWNAPRKTGYLASTVVKDVGVGVGSVQVLASYARYVAEGTRPHEIRPVNGRVLVFAAPNGGLVFTQVVHHPGTKPNPWLQDAVAEGQSRVEEVFAAVWLEELGA
jgi:hypothetical protein